MIPGLGRSPAEVKRLLTSVFLPGEFHGQRSLVGYSPLGCKDLDITEQLNSSTSSSSPKHSLGELLYARLVLDSLSLHRHNVSDI